MNKIKNIIANIGLTIISTLVVLIICEIFIRVFGHQDMYISSVYPKKMFDSSSSRLRANFKGEMLSSEIGGNIKINSKGLRDIERKYEKEDSSCRILGLGDSFTFGHGVEFEESFLTILENKLESRFDNIEIIKAGAPGNGLENYLALLKNEGIKYNPDFVMVNFFVGNDIYENTTDVNNANMQYMTSKAWLRRNVHLYSFVADRLKTMPAIRKILIKNNLASGLIGSHVIDVLKKEHSDTYIQSWKKAEELFTEMKAVNPNLIVVIIPTREQVEEKRLKRAVDQLRYNMNEIDKFHPNKKLLEICNKLQIGLIDLTPDFITSFESDEKPLYFDIDPHFNQNGHRLASTAIFKRIIIGRTDNGLQIRLCLVHM